MTKTLHTDGHLALISARKSQKISQAALADRLKCHQSFVARIESGQRRIDVSELVIIARALDVPAEHFFDAVIKAVPPGERL